MTKTRDAAQGGGYELFKTAARFDATAEHPDLLGGQTPTVPDPAPPGNGQAGYRGLTLSALPWPAARSR